MTFSTATQVRGLKAVALFYGRSPSPIELVKNIEAPVLAHYGEKDAGVNQDIPATVEAMKSSIARTTIRSTPARNTVF